MGNKKEKTRELGITHEHKEEDGKQQHAEVQDAREDDDKCKDNKISQCILDACNHKIRKKKVTYFLEHEYAATISESF